MRKIWITQYYINKQIVKNKCILYLMYKFVLIYRFNKSLTHRIYVQQIYKRCKNEQSSSSIDTSNLQTMQDSNYIIILFQIFLYFNIIVNYLFE